MSTSAPYPIPCPYCGDPHTAERCPRIRSVEYHPQLGGIRRVEFFEPAPPAADRCVVRTAAPLQLFVGADSLRAIVGAFGGDPSLVDADAKWALTHKRYDVY